MICIGRITPCQTQNPPEQASIGHCIVALTAFYVVNGMSWFFYSLRTLRFLALFAVKKE